MWCSGETLRYSLFDWLLEEACWTKWKAYPASVLQHWCGKYPACELCHFIVDNNTKFFKVWIRSTHHAVTLHLRNRKACIYKKQRVTVPHQEFYIFFFSHLKASLSRRPWLTDQSTDFFLSVRSRSCCCFDHCGSLIVCELLYTSLSCHNITDLPRGKEKFVFCNGFLCCKSLLNCILHLPFPKTWKCCYLVKLFAQNILETNTKFYH